MKGETEGIRNDESTKPRQGGRTARKAAERAGDVGGRAGRRMHAGETKTHRERTGDCGGRGGKGRGGGEGRAEGRRGGGHTSLPPSHESQAQPEPKAVLPATSNLYIHVHCLSEWMYLHTYYPRISTQELILTSTTYRY